MPEENIQTLLRTAIEYHASDLYIGSGAQPILRVNGKLVPIKEHPVLTSEIVEKYLHSILPETLKQLMKASLDVDGGVAAEGIGRFRVNVFRQRKGLSAVFRVIPEKPLTLDELQLPPQLKELTKLKQGLVLITGPTGCGKSSTLAALINEINQNQQKHIITVEDPIEFIHENQQSIIEQREIGAHTANFQDALRSGLREDPDVILVGEMRDLETISLAITAAETGHLIFSTLHTSGAGKAIDRIIDVFPADQQQQVRTQVSETLEAIIWQQLLPAEQTTVNSTKRIAACEILRSNHAVQNLIRKGHTHQIDSVIETSRKEGMQTMEHALKELAKQKIISEKTLDEYLPDRLEY
ncbi:PilT/PilU family type 4a pilus ATPase [Candidatus Peregrinibacteria bacterium]|jgi:twitching motility protein PilT|nr:PilT/PilU family type 4a pilus ATPase [Candidatus Peregrinibacteria bacterium]MBT7483387.1 PilT/PilU family type 4a pilus ATPase [Candidatus Peregrinibacteria bacterium]MBT7703148.1 PilT/PilU family type 4a pilus ATPase [Candidatus Peregrinibacteria bacterium]